MLQRFARDKDDAGSDESTAYHRGKTALLSFVAHARVRVASPGMASHAGGMIGKPARTLRRSALQAIIRRGLCILALHFHTRILALWQGLLIMSCLLNVWMAFSLFNEPQAALHPPASALSQLEPD